MNRLCRFVAVLVSCWAIVFPDTVAVAQQQSPIEQMTPAEIKEAQTLNLVYVKHLSTQTCVQKQKLLKKPGNETPEQLRALSLRYEKSCSCMTDILLSKYSPVAVLDAIVTLYGTKDKTTTERTIQKLKSPDSVPLKIMNLSISPEVKSKCGL